jgi:pimeloyl-ACP methyl ester carboxylesterase
MATYSTPRLAGRSLYEKKMAAMRLLAITGLFNVLLLMGCQAPVEVAPAAAGESARSETAARKAVSTQTVTLVDGSTALVQCREETLDTGEIIQICVPTLWNGELILYAHGYVSEFEPLRLPAEAVGYAPLYTALGYAFATTSFSQNGLAIQTGIDDILRLRKKFAKEYGEPVHTYLTGGSQGGIITTLAVERYPKLFSGGLSLCGPCGNFQAQINYYGDFRVLFDYFFPGVLPGDAVNIPDGLIANWNTVYVPAVVQAISQQPQRTLALLSVAGAPFDVSDPTTVAKTVISVLWYDVFTTRDAVRKLGGQPFDNRTKVYAGTGSLVADGLINAAVQRFSADPKAAKNIAKYYETSGDLRVPLVTGHTTKDPIQLFWHLGLYQNKVLSRGNGALFTAIPVDRYGHCTFTNAEIAGAFGLLLLKVNGQASPLVTRLLTRADHTGRLVASVSTGNK